MPLYNDINASKVLFEAVKLARSDYDFKNEDNSISVTSLLQPPKVIELNKRYKDKIMEPLSKSIRSFVGTATHKLIEMVEMDGLICEERLTIERSGYKVSGKFDILLLDDLYNLQDNKITSFWKILYNPGGEEHWHEQMNIYKYMIDKCLNIKVNKISINAIFFDWHPALVKTVPKAPKAPEMTIDIPMWPDAKIEKFLDKRIELHKKAQELPDDAIPICTQKERWHNPKKYILYKEGNKTPSKSFYNYNEMNKFRLAWLKKGVEYRVEVKDAVDNRCTQYCFANGYCNYYQEMYMNAKEKK